MRDALVDGYDLVIFDLDGVVYLGDQPVAGAPEALAELRGRGVPRAYATNNASRRAAEVAALLTSLGVPAQSHEVTTAAQASARVLADRLPAGSQVLVVGAPALYDEVADVGLRPVRLAEESPVAVVQGFGPKVGWEQLAEASVAIRAGASWIATNADRTLPTPRGPLPGNGSLVAALATALGRQPDVVVGKPEPTLFEQVARARGARRALVVGDRVDTDVEGAHRAGMDSLLVLTGAGQPADVLAAPAQRRPTYLAADLGGLFAPADEVRVPPKDSTWRVSDGRLSGSGDPVAALRVLAGATALDGAPAADGPDAERALRVLGLIG
ncbi:HAD-IIA family hydrolase [Planosporangium sp. 12N6]|uniref:HAD-IIA family hydrolase n=1 Tax=Planosporangium spinosum TaxID=3402278 RepID=UPI003CF0662E